MPPVTKLFEAVALPPGLLLVLVAVGLFLALRKRTRSSIACVSAALLLGYLLSIVPVCDLLLGPLESRYPPIDVRRLGSPAPSSVVVLSGGMVPDSPDMHYEASPAPEYLKRLVYGAALARRLHLPLIISGGMIEDDPTIGSLAEAGESALFAYGLAPRHIRLEQRSLNTWQNAADVEREYHPGRIILVTSAYHMPRAMYAFARHGISAIPAPTDYQVWHPRYNLESFLPAASSLLSSAEAIKEWIGLLYYHLLPTKASVPGRAGGRRVRHTRGYR